MDHNSYMKQLHEWNRQLHQFLQDENISEKETIWRSLHQFTSKLENIATNSEPGDEELVKLQEEVDDLHGHMENYFKIRQKGSIYLIEDKLVLIGQHELPPLPYKYNALEPVITAEIMKLHHSKHHQSYVNGLNKAEKELKKARETGEFNLVKHWERELAFHGAGHYLHTVFWNNMAQDGGGTPKGELLKKINHYFGSFEAFQKQFSEVAIAVEGVGWAILIWSPRSRHLEILQAEKHQLHTQWESIPLLVLDVWEHAYYLQYKNNRAEYVQNWWNIVNWDNVEERFESASKLQWKPY